MNRSITWRHRGYLPHLEMEGSSYFVTFRLTGSIPWKILQKWKWEYQEVVWQAQRNRRVWSLDEIYRLKERYFQRIDDCLDRGMGHRWLQRPEIAKVVVDTLGYFDDDRYALHGWSVMPTHVHTVFTPRPRHQLRDILHSWKSYTATRANQLLGRSGRFWQREYYDHAIRDQEEFEHYVWYTVMNPVKAGLCVKWQDWPWSGRK